MSQFGNTGHKYVVCINEMVLLLFKMEFSNKDMKIKCHFLKLKPFSKTYGQLSFDNLKNDKQ